jgi:predicted glycoside hydrolase/deacetylase ChbG (UPF0249 family)
MSFLLLELLSLSVCAQEKQLSPRAQELTRALAALHSKPDDPMTQEQYLQAFPHDYKTFLDLFDLDHELYDGHDYIDVLPSLARNHDTQVGTLLVGLSKDAHKEADAPTYLQLATAAYGSQHTKSFANLLKQLPTEKENHLITFMADVENHRAYAEYQGIIDHLKGLEEQDLANKFEEARKKKEQRPHG